MMKTNEAIAATVFVATTILGGCASPYYQPVASQPYPATTRSYSTGVVDSIQVIQASSGSGIGVGAVVGGMVGGLLGNQVGGGTGKTAATVAGVVGGAMVGNQMEQSNKAQARDRYQIGVRLDDGSYQAVIQDSITDLHIGGRVRIENDRVYRY